MPFDRCCVVLVVACSMAVSACDSSTPISPTPAAKPPVTSPTPGPGAFGSGPLESGTAPATTIAAGDRVTATIGRDDAVCDPGHWDANAPCKRFIVVVSTPGVLRATLTTDLHGARPDAIDLMLLGDRSIMDYSGGGEEQQVSGSVSAGGIYELRVNSYPYYLPLPGTLTFELRTEFRPGN